MSQEVTNEELEKYWVEVAHAVNRTGNGVERPSYGKQLMLDWMIEDWNLELASRGQEPDTL